MIFVRLLIVWQVLISKLHTQIFTLWTWYAALIETQPIGLHIQFDLWVFMLTGKDLIEMLYRYIKEPQTDGTKKNVLHPLEYYSCADIGDKEKDLEELIVAYMSELYTAGGLLMPIFQERQYQEEPDIMALDQYGNLVLFELKRGKVGGDTALQLMRYAQKFGRYGYVELDHLYRQYSKSDTALSEAHQSVFALTDSLSDVEFNQHQKLVIVGSTSDDTMIGAVNYWRAAGLDIDFLTYRIYKIGEEEYFEFLQSRMMPLSIQRTRKVFCLIPINRTTRLPSGICSTSPKSALMVKRLMKCGTFSQGTMSFTIIKALESSVRASLILRLYSKIRQRMNVIDRSNC